MNPPLLMIEGKLAKRYVKGKLVDKVEMDPRGMPAAHFKAQLEEFRANGLPEEERLWSPSPVNPGERAFTQIYVHLRLRGLRQLPDEELKRLWDTIGEDSFSEGFDCADIHQELNLRGLGAYCAV